MLPYFVQFSTNNRVLRFIIFQLVPDTLSMESVQTWEDVEFSFEDGHEAKITGLRWVDGDVPIPLFSHLFPQYFSILRVMIEFFL